jgi:hypothetical protein
MHQTEEEKEMPKYIAFLSKRGKRKRTEIKNNKKMGGNLRLRKKANLNENKMMAAQTIKSIYISIYHL